MFLYFFVLDESFFTDVMTPALSRGTGQRSFVPCLDLCRSLLAQNSRVPQDAVIRAILDGLPWDRHFWHALVGECLVHGAVDIPRLQTAPETLSCLLAPDRSSGHDGPRPLLAPIQQVHFGARDLRFGSGYYRPDHAGLNNGGDVARLAAYLESIDPDRWTTAALARVPEEERAEELADALAWWPGLVELYQTARARHQVVVCEQA